MLSFAPSLPPIAAGAAGDTLAALLQVLGDPQATTQRLEALKQAESALADAIAAAKLDHAATDATLRQRSAELDQRQAAVSQSETEFSATAVKRQSDLDAREKAVSARESSADEREKKLASDEADLGRRVAQFQAAVAGVAR